jgi:hypothetical protein
LISILQDFNIEKTEIEKKFDVIKEFASYFYQFVEYFENTWVEFYRNMKEFKEFNFK